MPGYNVPASRNGLPLAVHSERSPAYVRGANPIPRQTNPSLNPHPRIPEPAVLPVNANIPKSSAAVRSGTVSGIGSIKSVSVARRSGTSPGPVPGNFGGGQNSPTSTAGGSGSGGSGGSGGGSGAGSATTSGGSSNRGRISVL